MQCKLHCIILLKIKLSLLLKQQSLKAKTKSKSLLTIRGDAVSALISVTLQVLGSYQASSLQIALFHCIFPSISIPCSPRVDGLLECQVPSTISTSFAYLSTSRRICLSKSQRSPADEIRLPSSRQKHLKTREKQKQSNSMEQSIMFYVTKRFHDFNSEIKKRENSTKGCLRVQNCRYE